MGAKKKIFIPSGFESHLVDSLEKEILQRDPGVQWNDVAGLNDAKAILQEAVVLPVIMPEFFKGIRRPWKVRLYETSCSVTKINNNCFREFLWSVHLVPVKQCWPKPWPPSAERHSLMFHQVLWPPSIEEKAKSWCDFCLKWWVNNV